MCLALVKREGMSLLEKIKEVVKNRSGEDRDALRSLAEKRAEEFARSYIMADVIAGVISGDGDFPELGITYSDCTRSEWYNSETQQYERKCDYRRGRGKETNSHESEGETTITMVPDSDFIRNIMGSSISFDKRAENFFMGSLEEELEEMGFDAHYSSDVRELVIHRVTTHCPDELKPAPKTATLAS